MLMTISPLQYPARLMEHGPKLPNLYKINQLRSRISFSLSVETLQYLLSSVTSGLQHPPPAGGTVLVERKMLGNIYNELED